MQLTSKGAAAPMLGGLASFATILKWTLDADFDLMFFLRKKGTTGREGVLPVYYDNQNAPGIVLSDDAGVGDTGGNNEEQAVITDFSHYDEVYICVMDYGAISRGIQARFDQADIQLILQGMDAQGQIKMEHQMKPTAGMMGNICCIGKIYRHGGIMMFENLSEVTSMKGLEVTNFLLQIGAYKS